MLSDITTGNINGARQPMVRITLQSTKRQNNIAALISSKVQTRAYIQRIVLFYSLVSFPSSGSRVFVQVEPFAQLLVLAVVDGFVLNNVDGYAHRESDFSQLSRIEKPGDFRHKPQSADTLHQARRRVHNCTTVNHAPAKYTCAYDTRSARKP